MRRLLPVLLVLLVLVPACDGDRPDVWEDDERQAMEENEVRALAAKLVCGEKAEDGDVEAELDFEDLVHKLKLQGSEIEPVLIEILGATDSWGVRLGVVDVLTAIGTKACVDAMLGLLQDEHPKVAWEALGWLRVVLDHQETPDKVEPDHPLPPLPSRYDDWPEYRRRFGAALHQRWTKWWEANRDQTTVD